MKHRANELDRLIGQRFKTLRVMANVSQEELGAATGVSFQQIQKRESGVNRMSIGCFLQTCEFLKVDAAELMTEIQNPKTIKPGRELLSPEAIKIAQLVDGMPESQRAAMVHVMQGTRRAFDTWWPAAANSPVAKARNGHAAEARA